MLITMFTPPPASLSTAQIIHSFGRLHAHQGEQDLLAGRAHLKAVEPALNGLEVKGIVYLAEAPHRFYETSVYYTPDEEWVLSGDCTCAATSDCQHCAALSYAWLRIKPAPVANAFTIERWLKQLTETQPQKKATQTAAATPKPNLFQWVYLLDRSPQFPHTLSIKVALQERSNPQKPWRSAQPFDIQGLWPPQGRGRPPLLSEDRDLMQMIWSLQQSQAQQTPSSHSVASGANTGGSVALRGKIAQNLLQDLLLSHRCFWQHPPAHGQAQALSKGELRPATPVWRVVPGGQQWQIALSPPLPENTNALLPNIFLVGEQGIYVDSETLQVGLLDQPARTLRQWLNAPVIPETALAEVRDRLIDQLPRSPLPKGFEIPIIQQPQAEPIPILDLLDADHCELYFAYGDIQLPGRPASSEEEQHYTRIDRQKKCMYQVTRHGEAEKKHYQTLLKSGLLPIDDSGHRLAFSTADPYQMHQLANQWHYWLHHHLPVLQKSGWQIQMHEAFRLQFISSPAWQGELIPDPETHGFDLALGVNLNGETLNLLPLLLRLLRTTPDIQAMRDQLATREIWVLPLDPDPIENWAARSQHRKLPQRWLEIPTRRLMRMLDILIELYDDRIAESNPDSLALSYYSALQVKSQIQMNPDDYGMEWQAPPELTRVVGQLLHPSGLKGVNEFKAPEGLLAELRPYQQRGVQWISTLANIGLNGILADDMGLGKTLQTLTLLLQEKQKGRLEHPALVVMPTSVLGTWESELNRFAPALRVLRHHGSQRTRDPKDLRAYDVILTTYTLFRQDVLLHRQHTYSWLILDEAQSIKNPRSRTALAACAQPATHRLCLSGTPLENNLENLWSLFHFLMPGFLDTLENFNRHFRNPIEKTQDLQRLQTLRERIQPFVLRRLKQEVAPELPPKTEILRTISLGNAQRDLYETLRLSVDKEVRKAIASNGFKQSRLFILDALLKLRQACCHPQLLKLPEAQKMHQSAKLEHLMELLPELLHSGRRILIFSQFVSMLRLIEARLQYRQLPYALLTGETRQRDQEIERFQSGEVPLFLISLKAGGVGLNLTAADTVIHYDPWWNPAAEQQATDRSWRIGQTQPVFVYRLIAKGTVEERILHMQAQKRALQQGLLSQGPLSLEQWELLSLIQESP